MVKSKTANGQDQDQDQDRLGQDQDQDLKKMVLRSVLRPSSLSLLIIVHHKSIKEHKIINAKKHNPMKQQPVCISTVMMFPF